MSEVLAVYSEKGGVGKSALAAGLAAAARRRGKRVIGGDLDPRGTFTTELGVVSPAFSMNDLLALDPQGETGLAAEALSPASEDWSGVRIIAAERALANRETDVTTGLEFRLRMALRGVIGPDGVGILDLPPRAGGRLVTSALVAATGVIIPATLDEDGRIGVVEALNTIRLVKDTGMNTDLRVVAIVPSIVPGGRTTLRDTMGKHLADTYGGLYRDDLSIPRHVIRQSARFACVPITADNSREAAALLGAYDRVLTAAGVPE